MNAKGILSIIAFLICYQITLRSQVSLNLNVDPNPTPKILEWALNAQTVTLTVNNSSQTAVKYRIKSQLFRNGELIGETKPALTPLRSIDPNSVEVHFAEDVVPENAVTLYGDIQKTVTKTGKIPAGNYRLCVKLVDDKTTTDVTNEVCQPFIITSYQQPRLILPLNGTEMAFTSVIPNITFQWSPVLPQPKFPVSYKVRLVPKQNGQTELNAYRYNTPIFETEVKNSTLLQYPQDALDIEPSMQYVWAVQSLDEDDKPIGENEGLSEIWGFRFEDNTITVKLVNLSALDLIYPDNQSKLLKSKSEVTFRWTNLKPVQSGGVNYEFRLVERPDNFLPAQHHFNNIVPLISHTIANDTFYIVNISSANINKDKEYVWGIIPKNPSDGSPLFQNAGYLEKFTFSFDPLVPSFPQLTNFDFKRDFPKLSSDKSHVLATIDVADNAATFNYDYILKPFKYEILPMANEPPLELYDVDTSHFHSDYHAFKLRKLSTASNPPLNLMEDLSGTYNVKYQYHILKRESFRLDTIALKDTVLQITFPLNEQLPDLTVFKFKESFPKLSSDKSHVLATIDVADDAATFNYDYILKPFKYEILPMANEPPLELYDVDTSHFHSDYHAFKLRKLNTASNPPINLMEALSGTYNVKYQYHILKREPFRLDTIALKDTVLQITFPLNDLLPNLTVFKFKESFPKLSSDKSHVLATIDVADNAASFNYDYILKPFKYEILPMANEPPLELYDVDTSHFHSDYHAFKLRKLNTASNPPINLMEDLSGTYNVKYQYHILKREPFRLDTIALKDTVLQITFPVDQILPQLTKFNFKQSFPRLSMNKDSIKVQIELEDNISLFNNLYEFRPFKLEILPKAQEPPLQIVDVDTSDYDLIDFELIRNGNVSCENLSGTYNFIYKYHVLKKEPFKLDTIELRDTMMELRLPMDLYNSSCDPLACTPNTTNLLSTLPSTVKLCGGLSMVVTSSSSPNPNEFKGTGEVFIPWLNSKFKTTFSNIMVNTSYELAVGDIIVEKSGGAPTYDSYASNLGTNVIKKIAKWASTNSPIGIPSGAINAVNNIPINALTVPLGINKSVGNGNTGITIAISDIKFSPGQNLLQAYAAISFGGGPNDTISFKSDNFYFTSAGPIKNIGNTNELKFPLLSDVNIPYGSGTNPVQLTFKKSGTFLNLTSTCNEGLSWCMNVDMDIEMPRAWLKPKNDDGTESMKAKATVVTQICNLNDMMVTLNLDTSIISATNDLTLAVQNLTWDNSSTKNPTGFTFPSGFNSNGFKGFTMSSGSIILPKDFLKQNSTLTTVNLNNWIIDYKQGITGSVIASPIVTFPGLNIADIGASIDSFILNIVNNGVKHGKIKGQLLLPLCDAVGSNPTVGNLDYSISLNANSQSLTMIVNPKGTMQDCPFFANGNLTLKPSSNITLVLGKSNTNVSFTLHGDLDFPDKEIVTYKLKMKTDFENIKFNYTKDKVNDTKTVDFDHGDWKFASEQKVLNNFPFTIDNFRKETKSANGKLYVGGIGFDLVANLNDNIGGEAGMGLLGYIDFDTSTKRLKAGFDGVNVSTVKIYANTNSVKLDGELIFQDTTIDNNDIKAVKGSLAADFKCLNVGVSAGAVFGKVNGANPYRFFMVQAKTLFTPGVPLFAGIALVGGGFGFYKNMEMTINDTILGLNGQTSSSQVFSGASFTPKKGPWGIKIQADIATTPSDEAFNGSIAFHGEFHPNSGGLSVLSVTGSGWSGAGVLERDKAFLNAHLEASYNFTNKIFDLVITANIEKPGIIVANNVSAKFHSDGLANEYYFHFGQPSDSLANSVKLFNDFNMKMYLMFGNSNITAPTHYFMATTIAGLNNVKTPEGNKLITPDFASGSKADLVSLGKGFAAGLGVYAEAIGTTLGGKIGFNGKIGAEFNLSMLDYGTTTCGTYNPIGFNGYYLNTSLAAFVIAEVNYIKNNGNTVELASLNAAVTIDAQFPDPYYFNATIIGNIAFAGGWVEAEANFNIEYKDPDGYPCTPSSPTTSSQTFTQEDATTRIGDIFTDIYVENNDNNYNPEQALQWKANFGRNESFTIPEQQSDGTVITRKFESRWNYIVSEQTGQGNFVPISNTDFTLGVDLNGRYYLNKNTIPKFGKPMFISASDGTMFGDTFSLAGRFEISGNFKAGDFDGNGVDDLLISKDNELYIMFNDGNKFYSPQKVLNSSLGNNVDSLHIADVNGDNKMDLILVDGTIMVYTAKNNGFVGINFEFNQGFDWSDGMYLKTNQCVFGDYDEDGKADLAFFENLEGPNLLKTDTTNYDDGSPNKNVMFICFSEGNKFTLPEEFYRDNIPMAYNFTGNKQGYTYKNLNGFHSIVIFGKVMEYDSYNNLYSLSNDLNKEITVNIALDSVNRTTTYMPNEYTGDFDRNSGVEAIANISGWAGENTIDWDYPEKYNHKFKIVGCPAIIGNFKNGGSLLNTSSNSSNNSGNIRSNSPNLGIGKKYDDILEYNCTEPSIKIDPNINILYQNYLTPNKHYKLKLSGKIKDVTDSDFNSNQTPIIKDEEYELDFSTKDSEKIRALISENKKVIRYFPPSPGGIDSSTSPRPSLPKIGSGKSTSIINSPISNKNKNN